MTTNEMPAVGQPAPPFTLPATEPEEISLSDFRGKHIVLAFYVLDFTGG
jgi:peroxiredoxin Q/BCP